MSIGILVGAFVCQNFIFASASFADTSCPPGRDAQYGFAHRVNDWDEIKGVFDLGANGIELDICYSTYKKAWMVSHADSGACWNPSAETLSEWLKGKTGSVYGWEDLVNNPARRKKMAALWVDVKTPDEANLLDAVKQIQVVTPPDISVVYELGELNSAGKNGFQKIKNQLQDNEGVMFWAKEVEHCQDIYDYFVGQRFMRNAVDHGHAADINDDVLVECNHIRFHEPENPYRFKQVFTFTNYYKGSIRDYVSPYHPYCTSGQIVGAPLVEWPAAGRAPWAMGWFFEVLGEFPNRKLATTADVFWPNEAPEVSVSLASQTVQYSDGIAPVSIIASDIDSSSLEISVDLPEGLRLLPEEECASSGSTLTCTWTLDGRALVGAGIYNLEFVVSDGINDSPAITTLSVELEDSEAILYPENPVAVQVASAGGKSGYFELMVDIKELSPDLAKTVAYAGDIGLAHVTAMLWPYGPGLPVLEVCSSAGVSGFGYGSTHTFICRFSDIPVNVYRAELTVTGGYYYGYADALLVVSDSSLGFTSGGGWFYWPGTENRDSEGPGGKTNFGFTARLNRKNTLAQGNLQLISRRSSDTAHSVKSKLIYGLAVGQTYASRGACGWASFIGQAEYAQSGSTGRPVDHEFIVYAEDCNKAKGGTDRFWIQLLDKDGNIIEHISMEEDATEHSSDLKGGNILVPHNKGR